ncbi:MAG: hypothetical protein QOF18_2397 [Frankiaceae bacterium]|nr:hypothetical protein [Frankiaceae bacterium]
MQAGRVGDGGDVGPAGVLGEEVGLRSLVTRVTTAGSGAPQHLTRSCGLAIALDSAAVRKRHVERLPHPEMQCPAAVPFLDVPSIEAVPWVWRW